MTSSKDFLGDPRGRPGWSWKTYTKTSYEDLEGSLRKIGGLGSKGWSLQNVREVVFAKQKVVKTEKNTPKTSQEHSRSLIKTAHDLFGSTTRLHQGRSRHPREHYAASSRPFKTSSRAFTRIYQGSPRSPREHYAASSEPFKTSSGALACLHQGRPRPPREHSRAFIRVV